MMKYLTFVLALLSLPCSAQQVVIAPQVPTATSITVSANPTAITIGATSALSAVALGASGLSQDITNQCLWSSSNPAVLRVTGTSALGLTAGTATATCSLGGITGSIPVSITVLTITFTSPVQGTCANPCVLPSGSNGVAYSFTFAASSSAGGPYSFSLSAGSFAACGVSLASSGLLSGSATTGVCTPTVQVTDGLSNSSTLAVTLTISSVTCGAPTYPCAASTNASLIVQLPGTLPTWTISGGPHSGDPQYGAGLSFTTNEFGVSTKIFRLTDLANNCNPNAATQHSSSNINSGSADEAHFNAVSPPTLVVLGSAGGWNCVQQVSANYGAQTLSFAAIDNNFSFPSTVNSVSPSANSSTPNIFYAQSNTQILKYDFTGYGPTATAPTPSTFYDFTSSNCLGSAYGTPTWVDHLTVSKTPADSLFGSVFSNTGGQDTGGDVVVYKVGSGCSHYNTITGAITGDWGSSGTAVINGGSGADRYKVHNMVLSKDGAWALIAYNTCVISCGVSSSVQYLWQVGTTTVLYGCTVAAGDKCGGHWTEGFSHVVNISGSFTFGEEIRPYAGSPNAPTDTKSGISTCTGSGFQLHMGWNNADASDTFPYYEFTGSPSESGLTGSTFTCPFLHEVDLVDPVAKKVLRESHTFNSGKQTSLFSCSVEIGAVSPDGGIAMWISDGMGAFGSTAGLATCSGSTCRCEMLGMILQ